MKKLLLLALLSVSCLTAKAQCTPDPNQTSPGIYPDSATGFSDGCVNEFYSQLITNVVPADTNIVVFGIPISTSIDSIVIDSLIGLPSGMTFECNPMSCSYPGGETGCATISGTCTIVGDYPLTFYLSAYVGGLSSANPYIVDYYSISITPCFGGLKEDEMVSFTVSPNPASENVVLEGLQNKKGVYSVSLMNLEGKTMSEFPVNGENSLNINLGNVNTGFYFIRVHSTNGNETVKLMVK